MIQNIYQLLAENWSYFSGLLWEHVVIALLSSIIAIILGLVRRVFYLTSIVEQLIRP